MILLFCYSFKLNRALVPRPSKNTTADPFWTLSEQQLLRACILYFTEKNCNFVESIDKIVGTPVIKLLKEMYENGGAEIKIATSQFISVKDEQLSSIHMGLINKIKVFREDENLRKALSYSETEKDEIIKPSDLEDGHDIYFVIRESDLERWSNLVNLIINQFLKFFENRTEDRKDCPILFVLDEFPRFGYIGSIENGLGTLRSKGITICLVVQSLAQLQKTYENTGFELIAGNCGYKAVLKASDVTTQEYFSKLAGTKEVTNYSYTIQDNEGKSGSHTINKNQEYVVKPYELAYIEKILLFTPKGHTWIEKTPYYSHPILKNLQNNKKKT